MSEDDQQAYGTTIRSLARISEALGISVEVLLQEYNSGEIGVSDNSTLTIETLALIDLFMQIEDQKIRRRCLNFVRAAAKGLK